MTLDLIQLCDCSLDVVANILDLPIHKVALLRTVFCQIKYLAEKDAKVQADPKSSSQIFCHTLNSPSHNNHDDNESGGKQEEDVDSTTVSTIDTDCEIDLDFFDFLARLLRYVSCSDAAFMTALLYLERLKYQRQDYQRPHKTFSRVILNSKTMKKLFLSSLLVACKYLEDTEFYNMDFAEVGQLLDGVNEMNKLEIAFLNAIDFRLHVTIEQLTPLFNHVATD